MIKDIMKNYFLDLDKASKDPNRKVAWCTSVGPAEILRAMDFEVFFPENHGALLGTSRVCMDTIPVANASGYSPDICSYLTSDIGAFLNNITPLTKAYGIDRVPTPDVLVYNTNQCKDVMHWFEFYAKHFDVPIFGIHSPNHLPEVTQAHVKYVVSQFKELIALLEKIQNKKYDEKKLIKTLALSKDATDLWSEVLSIAKNSPSPLSFSDGTIFMGPIVVLRGTEIAHKYYKSLLDDLNEKLKKREFVVPNEKVRLYWDGMPIWGRLRMLSELFIKNNACVVASTYCSSWAFHDFDLGNPFESMAKSYLAIFINRNDNYKEKYIVEKVKEFNVNGVIFHESKTCPNNANSQYGLPGRLRAKGIPNIVINGDLCDLRCFSDEQSTTIIEAFLETLV